MVCDWPTAGAKKTNECVVVIFNARMLRDTTKKFITLCLPSSIFLISLDHLSENIPTPGNDDLVRRLPLRMSASGLKKREPSNEVGYDSHPSSSHLR